MALEGMGGALGGAASPLGMRPVEGLGARPGASGAPAGAPFESALASALQELEGAQAVADESSMALVTGQDIAVHQVMASVTEAEIATQLTTAVAAKAIQAYQEIWRMEI